MRAAVYFASLAQVLVLHSVPLGAQTATPSISHPHADSQQENRVGPARSYDREKLRLELLRRAEAAFRSAGARRDKQTARELTVAVRLFRASAEIFGAAGSYERAADAYLQAGEIYSTLGQYQNARGS